MYKKLSPLVFILILSYSAVAAITGLNFSPEEKPPVGFFSAIEQKKKLLEKLQTDLENQEKKIPDLLNDLHDESLKIDHQIDVVKYSLSYVRNQQESVLKNKKISVLAEIKQVLSNREEELKETAAILATHIRITREYLAAQNQTNTSERAAYSWQELRETQLQTGELTSKLEADRKKREDLVKQKAAEAESIVSLQKRLEVHEKEQTKNTQDDQSTSRTRTGAQLKLSNEIFELESQLLQKKIELARTKISRLDLEISTKNDEVELVDIQQQNKKYLLSRMEKSLNLTSYDVEGAKAETNIASHKAIQIKEVLAKKIDEKKSLKDQAANRRTSLQQQLKNFTGQSHGSTDSVTYHVLQSEIHKCTSIIHLLDREIDFLNIKRELADLAVHSKEIIAHDVEIRYQLFRGRADAEDLAHTFKNQRDIALGFFKKMRDKHDEILKSYGDRSRCLEDIKTIQSKIHGLAASLFGSHHQELAEVNTNLEESRQAVTIWFSISQEYIATSTDYLARYEKILSQYDLILENLQNHRSRFGLWKRSTNALTLPDLTKALKEGELFLKQLFFEAPKHLSFSSIIKSIKATTWQHAVNIGLLILFFLVFLISIYITTTLLTKFLRSITPKNTNDKKLLYTTIALGALQFLQANIIVASLWLFFYLHIICNFSGPFILLKPYALPYYITLFYLISIPIFILLVRNLLARLKELNKKISFLSFPENFQERLELLLTAYCYTLSVLMPLRQAALNLLPNSSIAFTNLTAAVIVSALSLLPFCIFRKKHILYLLPDTSSFWIWIKKQVDDFYYPLAAFFLILFLLSRSFVGYSNLATFLSFSIPLTILVFYGMFLSHVYIRKHAIFLFIKESDEEFTDKFEHAKTYYGFFVIFSFLILLILSTFIIARIWELNISMADFWRFLSDTIVVPIGVDRKFGFIQFVTLIIFVAGGFLFSSITHRFVLNRLFDILRTEPGTQNTITKIVHYLTIALSVLLGFVSIHLEQLIWYIGTTLAVGLGFALKDILTDYVAGFFVLIERPIEIGNYVRLDNNTELQGVVHKIDARTTTIMTRLNHSVIIANKDLVTKVLSNWGKGRFAVGFEIKILVSYDSNIDEVKKTILEIIQSNPVVLRVPNVILRVDDFEEGGIYFLARAFISARRVQEQWTIAGGLREELLKAFKAKGIQFGFPQRVVHLSNVNSTSPIQFNFEK